MDEEWRELRGFEGLYEISSLGRIKRLARKFNDHLGRPSGVSEMIMRESSDHEVVICKDKKYYTLSVRSLVAENFLNIPYGEPISHIDRDTSNSSVSNIIRTEEFRKLDPDWKDIPGWEGEYQASRFGQVRSVDRYKKTKNGKLRYCPGVIRDLEEKQDGYYQVSLYKDGKCLRCSGVHVYVALAWIPNPENKPTVNHIDGDKHNNCVENLEWATYSEQQEHALRTGLRNRSYWDCSIHGPVGGTWNESRKISVRCIETGETFSSLTEAAEAFNCGAIEISYSVNEHSVCQGFHFVRSEESDYEIGVVDLENEIWRDVPGFEGLYKFSNKDRLKSVQRQVDSAKGRRTVPEKLLSTKNGFGLVNGQVSKQMGLASMRRLVFPDVKYDDKKRTKRLFNID